MLFFDVRATHETSPTCHSKHACWLGIWLLEFAVNYIFHVCCIICGEFVQSLLLRC